MFKQITIKTNRRNEFQDITSQVQQQVRESGIKSGICVIYITHTTAGVTINENADPDVCIDMELGLEKISPLRAGYAHQEGNSDAHIKSSLVGCSETIIIEEGRLVLGTWQGIYFCEFDGPRTRKAIIKIMGDL